MGSHTIPLTDLTLSNMYACLKPKTWIFINLYIFEVCVEGFCLFCFAISWIIVDWSSLYKHSISILLLLPVRRILYIECWLSTKENKRDMVSIILFQTYQNIYTYKTMIQNIFFCSILIWVNTKFWYVFLKNTLAWNVMNSLMTVYLFKHQLFFLGFQKSTL